ncbi:MAG: S-formylglutathione hydrolase [Spongiibacteraceae bacterium]|nr:S-formylglutathione hydrolase [Spongiibacteraceae bacterium]
MSLQEIASNQCFDGQQLQYTHQSQSLNCSMRFSIFLPPQAKEKKVPVLYWLSGLTCSDENFVQKAGAQQYASRYGVAIVAPDTSPRGDDVPDDPEAAYDFGLGAGFYVDATQEPWAKHYQMYHYITQELPSLITSHFSVDGGRVGIFGHSMGGHGALTIALKNPDKYKSASAFSPICSPIQCPWGQKALGNYLGNDVENWKAYDTTELIAQCNKKLPILVDQGSADQFLQEQLKPELLTQACEASNYPLELRIKNGYDHSYFFIASFMEDHIRFHCEHI